MAPSYLSGLLVKYEPVRNLRSTQKGLYVVHVVKTKGCGKRCFAHAAPELWNNIPYNIRHADTENIFI